MNDAERPRIGPAVPLAHEADLALAALARDASMPRLNGATMLGERARLEGYRIGGRVSAGGGCRLIDAVDGMVALNLVRGDDRDLLPALFADDGFDPLDDAALATAIRRSESGALVTRGRLMGLAIAALTEETSPPPAVATLVPGLSATRRRSRPRVLDLSALWAGPLAAHLLWLAGAEVWKVESLRRPDAMRGDGGLFALLNQGKASVTLDFASNEGRAMLLRLIASADIVIEAARPRALAQLGIDADRLVREIPGLLWLTITAHGATGDAAEWVGFGDDVGVSAGLTAAMIAAGGGPGFVGDAIADPLTGIHAATTAWTAWSEGAGGRIGIAMRGVTAACLAAARSTEPDTLDDDLRAWSRAAGTPFPPAPTRAVIAPVSAFGADTRRVVAALDAC